MQQRSFAAVVRKEEPPPQEEPTFWPHAKAFDMAVRFSNNDITLDVCFENGNARFFPWHHFEDALYVPGLLLVCFKAVVVEVEGRHLGELAKLVKQNRVAYIQERHEDVPETEAYINKITLHPTDAWAELILPYA